MALKIKLENLIFVKSFNSKNINQIANESNKWQQTKKNIKIIAWQTHTIKNKYFLFCFYRQLKK